MFTTLLEQKGQPFGVQYKLGKSLLLWSSPLANISINRLRIYLLNGLVQLEHATEAVVKMKQKLLKLWHKHKKKLAE